MSPVYDCSTDEGRRDGVGKAVEAVRAGEIVVLPTDTVYGVGADAFSAEAVASLLAAKGRGREMPPPVLVPSVRTVDGLATDVPAWARDLIAEFWPGPLTLVFKAQSSLMWDLGETNGTVALRMPKDDIALAVLTEVGPMAVTSANLTGQPPATTATDAASQLGAAVSVYLDGGPTTSTEVSTIVDCTGEELVVLRTGALTEDQLRAALEPRPADEPDQPDEVDEVDRAELPDPSPDVVDTPDSTESDGTQAIELPADPDTQSTDSIDSTGSTDSTDSTLPGDPHER
jgi:tRNA threonylcarbamoyl adenosine modification protein (Sua5/YciO/YrdC/YwlC family)